MENKRIILYFALALVGFLLWSAWQQDYAPKPAPAVERQESAAVSGVPNVPASEVTASAAAVPTVPTTQAGATPQAPVDAAVPADRMIRVTTDLLDLEIDTLGGNIVKVGLRKYPVEQDTPEVPIVLMDDSRSLFYVAESGLTGPHGPDTAKGQVRYQASQTQYQMGADSDQLQVVLRYDDRDGLMIDKVFSFDRDDYAIKVSYQVNNLSSEPWVGNFYGQIRKSPTESPSGFFALQTFQGASLSTQQTPYEKLSFDDLKKNNVSESTLGGWLAMQQRYFLTAWVPAASDTNHFYSRTENNRYTMGFIGPQLTVAPGASQQVSAQFYVGPEIADNLTPLAPHLEKTIDYGWLWIISAAIFWIMKHIHNIVGNWGWSIVLVTFLIKALFYKLSERSYYSMAKMRKLTPRIQQLKERYGDDKQKMSRATMDLYKKEGVNPLGGCLPMLIQIPFFIALYYVLIESVELRQAPFIFWIHDLSQMDPFYVLPIIMGLSMLLQQKLNPAPADPMQAKVMMFLPIVFTLLFMTFPSGLVLYWLVSNLLSIAQQWYIMRKYERSTKVKKKPIAKPA